MVRLACAWLILRFIDPEAKFTFVQEKDYQHHAGELRFDMFAGEFTHEGDRCSFETLLHRYGLEDPALAILGEIVHDIDLKEDKYGREETAGVARLIEGIALPKRNDPERLARGLAVFDDLLESFRGGHHEPR